MGEMLAQTERAKPPGDNQHKKKDRLHDVTEAPTLSELGLTKRESAEAQLLAEAETFYFLASKTRAGVVCCQGESNLRPDLFRARRHRICCWRCLYHWRTVAPWSHPPARGGGWDHDEHPVAQTHETAEYGR